MDHSQHRAPKGRLFGGLPRLLAVLILGVTLLGGSHLGTPSAAAAQACFAETGFCVGGRFLEYWQGHGGLAINGFPVGPEQRETLEDGKEYTVQYFERARFELHPEAARPHDVQLGQFGRRILLEEYVIDRFAYRFAVERAEPKPGLTYFAETGHNLSPLFADFWHANGGLAQFGYPITEERWDSAPSPAGACCRTQYFERARFEYHPEHEGTPYVVLLGQFGRRIMEENALLAGPFSRLYLTDERVRGLLGAPTDRATLSAGAMQPFERGLMFYQGDRGRIFVLCDQPVANRLVVSGQYGSQLPYFADTWREGQEPGGGPGPSAGLYRPVRGFGKVWRENEERVQECLGHATTATERGYQIAVQGFEGGFLLTDPEGNSYAISLTLFRNSGLIGRYDRFATAGR